MTTFSTSSGNRLRILCDVDGVLADFVGTFLDYIQRTYGLSYSRDAINQWDCMVAVGMPKSEWRRFSDAVAPLELCRKMLPLPGAAAFLVALESACDVQVATTPMNAAWLTQRAEWLEEHMGLPLDRQKHLHAKEELTGGPRGWDVLIDDKVENCVAFTEAGGIAFCIATPYNVHLPSHIARGTHAECLDFVAALVPSAR